MKVEVLVVLLCPPLCDPIEPTRVFCPWNSPGKNTGVGCRFLLQEIFLTRHRNQVSCIAGSFFTI